MPHQIAGLPLQRHLSLIIISLLLAACAGTPTEPEFAPPVYPAPPDEARFIFERTLRYNTNVEALTTGQKLRRFATGESNDVKGLVKPYDVAAKDGRVYVTDTVQRAVLLFDIKGQRYKEIGLDKPGRLYKPTGIDISSRNELFVADIGKRRIVVYDLEGQFKRYIGSPDLLIRPADVSASVDGQKLYVIDTGGVDTQDHYLHIFDAQSGKHLAKIGGRGIEKGKFNLPLQLTTSPDGSVVVIDKGNFRVQIFDANGKFKHSFGTVGRYPGQFFSPKGISTDNDGNIYVVDTAFGNTQIFSPKGELLMVIGQRGQSSKPGNYMLPAGIDVDENGKVYIVDQFFRKVDIYRPVKQLQATARTH